MKEDRIPMIQIDDAIVSMDCLSEKFCCDLEACKGACCVEGDAGAPLELDEVAAIEDALEVVWPMLSASAQAVMRRQDALLQTPLVPSLSHPAQENRWRGGAELPPVGRVPHGRGEGTAARLAGLPLPERAAGAAFWRSLVCRTGERRGGTEGARLSAGLNKRGGVPFIFTEMFGFFSGLIYFCLKSNALREKYSINQP